MRARQRDDEGRQLCVAHLTGRDSCGCVDCESDLATRRARILIYVTAALVAAFLLFATFAVPEARCSGPCFGSCSINVGCGSPTCGCVPTMPGSPLGTCVGGG